MFLDTTSSRQGLENSLFHQVKPGRNHDIQGQTNREGHTNCEQNNKQNGKTTPKRMFGIVHGGISTVVK
jgi:hypothetical protein